MKDNGRRTWLLIAIAILLAVLMVLALVPTGVARTILLSERAFRVMYRTLTELMPSTPAGQYYRAMALSHNDDWSSIYFDQYPTRFVEVTYDSIDLFLPGMEALLDGHGQDEVVTAEAAQALQDELDWLLTVASPDLCADIRKEEARFPPQILVGMTYAEAWDYINANWTPDPAQVDAFPTPTPYNP